MIPAGRRRVVVTGAGSASALCVGGMAAVAAALEEARPRLAPIRAFSPDGASRLAGELPEGALAGLVEPHEARRLSRVCQLTVATCRLALRDAGLRPGGEIPGLGLVVGTEFGDIRSSEEFFSAYLARGSVGLSPMIFPNTVMNTMAASAAIAVRARGPSVTLNQATVAGELAIARAALMVARGRLQAALAGGVDELSPILHRTLSAFGGLSPADGADEGCRPFDRRRNGSVRGEGATFVLIEPLDAALRRGAVIHAEVAGAAWGNHPAGGGRARSRRDGAVIRSALAQAGLRPEEIGWAYLTGTGDPRGEDRELDLIAGAFGTRAPRLTSLTPLCGEHAGLGGLKVAGAAWTAKTGRLPPLCTLVEPVRAGAPLATGGRAWEVGGAGLVHGVARGGTHVVLVVSPAA